MGPRTTPIPLSSDAFSLQDIIVILKSNERATASSPLNEHRYCNWRAVVYLQHHGVELFVLVQLFGTGEDGGGFASSRRTVEQEMRKLVFTDKPLDWKKQEAKTYQVLRMRPNFLKQQRQGLYLRYTTCTHWCWGYLCAISGHQASVVCIFQPWNINACLINIGTNVQNNHFTK